MALRLPERQNAGRAVQPHPRATRRAWTKEGPFSVVGAAWCSQAKDKLASELEESQNGANAIAESLRDLAEQGIGSEMQTRLETQATAKSEEIRVHKEAIDWFSQYEHILKYVTQPGLLEFRQCVTTSSGGFDLFDEEALDRLHKKLTALVNIGSNPVEPRTLKWTPLKDFHEGLSHAAASAKAHSAKVSASRILLANEPQDMQLAADLKQHTIDAWTSVTSLLAVDFALAEALDERKRKLHLKGDDMLCGNRWVPSWLWCGFAQALVESGSLSDQEAWTTEISQQKPQWPADWTT